MVKNKVYVIEYITNNISYMDSKIVECFDNLQGAIKYVESYISNKYPDNKFVLTHFSANCDEEQGIIWEDVHENMISIFVYDMQSSLLYTKDS